MDYRIAICDDSKADTEYLSTLAKRWARAKGVSCSLNAFSCAESLLFDSSTSEYDILLLDIEMSGMDGVTLARRIREKSDTAEIIFVTGYSDYICDGYDVGALHYLLKPVKEERLYGVLDRALTRLRKNGRSLVLALQEQTVRVPLHEIRYLEVRQNYVTVHCKGEYTVKKPLSEFEAALDERFFRTGRSHIVNLSFVRRVTKTDVYLSDGTSLPLPRGAFAAVNRAIIERT